MNTLGLRENTIMQNILGTHKLLRLSLIALAFTPLVVTSATMYPFIFGKVSFIRLVTATFIVLFSVYLWKMQRGDAIGKIDFRKLKNPIFITFLGFVFLNLLGVFFAPNPYVAFFGNIERGEGFLILLYMLIFLAGTILFFEKKEWTIFFKLVLIVGVVIAFDIITQYLVGRDYRPDGIFLGNPIFVSTYLLFGIFSALLVRVLDKSKLWKIIGYGSIPLFFLTILITRTRGVFVGLVVSVVIIALALLFKSDIERIRLFRKEISLRRLGLLALMSIVIFSSIFVVTRSYPIWQAIPGLDRLAQISTQDLSTQTRLINIGPSLRAVNPVEAGLGRALMGWGPDNFNIAYEKFYNPHIQKYELEWFDRAHNKLLDVLVMNGILGLGAYLMLWFYVFQYGFVRRKLGEGKNIEFLGNTSYQLPVLLITTAYFVQNLFVFDQISTYIPFFALLGFIAHGYNEGNSNQGLSGERNVVTTLYASISSLLALLLVYGFIWLSAIPYHQMDVFRRGQILVNQGQTLLLNPAYIEENLDKITRPINYVQAELRERMLSLKLDPASKQDLTNLSLKILALEEETAPISSGRPKTYSSIGFMYNKLGKTYGLQELFSSAEKNFKKSLELAPGRQETMFHYANNLVNQGRIEEAISVADNIVAIEPNGLRAKIYWITIVAPGDWDDQYQSIDALIKYYDEANAASLEHNQPKVEVVTKFITELSMIRISYNNYLGYFFQAKDSASFLKTMRQAKRLEETIRDISQDMVSLGILSNSLEDGVENIESGIRAFVTEGWDAISF